ncbi:MAG: tetratricopeptide repeat protein, partial [Blastocatellia bacterium]
MANRIESPFASLSLSRCFIHRCRNLFSAARLSFLLIAMIGAMLMACKPPKPPIPPTPTPPLALSLKSNQPIEMKLKSSEVHRYLVEAVAGQFLRVLVEQRGIDVIVSLHAPNGDELLKVDSPGGGEGPESVSVVAEAQGSYQIKVLSLDKEASGRYEAQLVALRVPTQSDLILNRGEKAEAEAEKLDDSQVWADKKQAVDKYKVALKCWQELRERRNEARTLSRLGRLYARSPEQRLALKYYDAAMPIWQELHDRKWEARVFDSLGYVHNSLAETQKALDNYFLALAIWQAEKVVSREALTLNNIGVAYSDQGEKRKALRFYEQAFPLFSDAAAKAETLNDIGVVYADLGEMQKALDAYNQAISLNASRDELLKAAILNNIGQVYVLSGAPQYSYYDEALKIFQTHNDLAGKADTLNYLGGAHWTSGNYQHSAGSAEQAGAYQEAERFYSESLALWRQAEDHTGEANTLHNLGRLYDSQGKLREALSHYEQARQLMSEVNDRMLEVAILNNLGFVNDKLGMRRQALDFHNRALQLCRKLGDQVREARVRYGIALIERTNGRLPQARLQIEKAIRIIERLRSDLTNPE